MIFLLGMQGREQSSYVNITVLLLFFFITVTMHHVADNSCTSKRVSALMSPSSLSAIATWLRMNDRSPSIPFIRITNQSFRALNTKPNAQFRKIELAHYWACSYHVCVCFTWTFGPEAPASPCSPPPHWIPLPAIHPSPSTTHHPRKRNPHQQEC